MLLNGEQITKTFNSNYAAFDDPSVDAEIDKLRGRLPSAAVNRAYGFDYATTCVR